MNGDNYMDKIITQPLPPLNCGKKVTACNDIVTLSSPYVIIIFSLFIVTVKLTSNKIWDSR